jgi:hypothetical protein
MYGQLEDVCSKALGALEESPGPSHPATLAAAGGLGMALARNCEAQAPGAPPVDRDWVAGLLARASSGLAAALGQNHADAIRAALDEGEGLLRLGKPGAALPVLEGAVDRYLIVWGHRSPFTAKASHLMAVCRERLGDLSGARRDANMAILCWRGSSSSEHFTLPRGVWRLALWAGGRPKLSEVRSDYHSAAAYLNRSGGSIGTRLHRLVKAEIDIMDRFRYRDASQGAVPTQEEVEGGGWREAGYGFMALGADSGRPR